MFVPYGRIVGLDAYRGLLGIRSCIGAKHSSLSRQAEWERLALRDEVRPEFQVLTGNDRAIDMVMWGSDYLLGLATFAPEEFARRDAYWESGDPRFFELNDVLQYLGTSPSVTRCRLTATTRRCSSSCAAGRAATGHRPGRRRRPNRTGRLGRHLAQLWRAL